MQGKWVNNIDNIQRTHIHFRDLDQATQIQANIVKGGERAMTTLGHIIDCTHKQGKSFAKLLFQGKDKKQNQESSVLWSRRNYGY